jgi:hypothetical protein
MKNLSTLILTSLCFAMFSIFSGCCDKEEDTIEPKNDQALVGTWDISKMTSEADGVIEILDQAQLDEMDVIWTYKIIEVFN